jgi:hypothetical protein
MLQAMTHFKQCACGARYTRDEWARLSRVAFERADVSGPDARTCGRCGATMAAVAEVPVSGPELPFTD